MTSVHITKLDQRYNRQLGRTVRYWRRDWTCPDCGDPCTAEAFGLRADVERIQPGPCEGCARTPNLRLEVVHV